MVQQEMYERGDRVSLKEPLGPLKPEDFGIIVEVYKDGYLVFTDAEGCTLEDVTGTKDFDPEFHGIGDALFDYGVVFPRLRGWASDYTEGPWLTDKVDLSQFHAGDVIPLAHDEVTFIDSELRSVVQ